MPQYRVKVRELTTDQRDEINVWAEDRRAANLQALKIAKRLLGRPTFEILSTEDLSPAAYKFNSKQPREHRKTLHGPVRVRFLTD